MEKAIDTSGCRAQPSYRAIYYGSGRMTDLALDNAKRFNCLLNLLLRPAGNTPFSLTLPGVTRFVYKTASQVAVHDQRRQGEDEGSLCSGSWSLARDCKADY